MYYSLIEEEKSYFKDDLYVDRREPYSDDKRRKSSLF